MLNTKYEKIMLKDTTNEKLQEMKSKIGTFTISKKDALVEFITENDKVEIPIILYRGDFFNPFCNSVFIKDEDGCEYTFDRTDFIYEPKTLYESEK